MQSWLKHAALLALCTLGFALFGYWIASPFWRDPGRLTIRMSAGPSQTHRHAIATYFSEQAAQNKLHIQLAPTKGSEDCLESLKKGAFDAAIVSNGVIVPDDDQIMVLGAVHLEAVHLLVRNDVAEGESVMEYLRGKRVNLDEKGSSEWLLAREFLSYAHLKLPTDSQAGDVIPTEYSKSQLIEMAKAILGSKKEHRAQLIAKLPDCMLVVASMPSTVVQLLIEAADYRIVPVPGTQAFLMDNLQASNSKKTVIVREFLEPTAIPKNSYFAKKGFPQADCETIGVRLLVVARKDLQAQAIQALMHTIFEGEFARRIKPKSPLELATPYAIHPAALSYLNRNKPLAIREVLDWSTKGFSLFGAFSAGALSLYGLIRSKKARKPTVYYAEIRKVNQEALSADFNSTAMPESNEIAKHLGNRLQTMRLDLIEDICEGRIKGDQAIANILSLLKDAEESVPRVNQMATSSPQPRNLVRRSRSQAA